jgi:hypothetical protein
MRNHDAFMESNALLDTYTAWFAARTDLYVKNASQVVRQPLTPEVIRQAVAHHYPISAYLGTEDGQTHVGAIDFDTHNGLEQARATAAVLWKLEVPTLLVHSRRGAHLWLTCWTVITAQQMRRALEAALLRAGLPEDPKIEVFPKPGAGLAAGALRMPGMPHQTTQQVYDAEVLEATGWQPLGDDLIDLLEAHMPTDEAPLLKLAAGLQKRQAYPKGLGGFYGYKPDRAWGETPKATEVLAAWGVEARAGQTVKCPKHDDHRRSLTIFKDDARVYCGSPACVLHGSGHGVGSITLARMK